MKIQANTPPETIALTTQYLRKYKEADGLGGLDAIRKRLLNLNPNDIHLGLGTAAEIKGLGLRGHRDCSHSCTPGTSEQVK